MTNGRRGPVIASWLASIRPLLPLASFRIGLRRVPALKVWLLPHSRPWLGCAKRPACLRCVMPCRLLCAAPSPLHLLRPSTVKACLSACLLLFGWSSLFLTLAPRRLRSSASGLSLFAFGPPCVGGTPSGSPPPVCNINSRCRLLSVSPSARRQQSAVCRGGSWRTVSWGPLPPLGRSGFFRAFARRSPTRWLSNRLVHWIFLPAVLSGSESRPLISEPWDRDRFVPWLRDLLCQHWSLHSREPLPPVFSLIAAQSLKATMLSWARQLSIESDARRIQGHHRLSGADRSVALYSRDDIIPMVRLWWLHFAAASVLCNRSPVAWWPLWMIFRWFSHPVPCPLWIRLHCRPIVFPMCPSRHPCRAPLLLQILLHLCPHYRARLFLRVRMTLCHFLLKSPKLRPQIRMRSRIGKPTWLKRRLSKPLPLHLGLCIIRAATLCTSLRLAPPTPSGLSGCFGKTVRLCMSVRLVVRRLAR